MDLRTLSSTPPSSYSVIQRRPSLSSLSSASGYESSNLNLSVGIGPGATTTTPKMAHAGISVGTGRMYPSLSDGHDRASLIRRNASPLATDVGPWVEQQKQQQCLSAGSLESWKKELPVKLEDKIVTIIASSTADHSPTNVGHHDSNSIEGKDDSNDDLIPTAIVIKNIPFSIKKEQLLEVMTKLGLPLPYAFNYHFDNGVFRGLAFANFASTDETSIVVNQLNGREVGGRKLRVEYKKMLPLQQREKIEREKRERRGQLEEQHRSGSIASLTSLVSFTSTTAATKDLSVNGQVYPSQTERYFAQFPTVGQHVVSPPTELNLADPEVLELYSQLLTYREDTSKLIFELAFPSTLSMTQRKVLSLACSFLNLLELFDNGLIIIRRKPGQQTIQQRLQQNATLSIYPQPQHYSLSAKSGSQRQGLCEPLTSTSKDTPAQTHGSISNGPSSHSSSMMNLSHTPNIVYPVVTNVNPSDLLRSQSQSSLPSTRSRPQSLTPVQHQQHKNQYLQYHHPVSQTKCASQHKYHNHGTYGGNCTAPSSQHIGTPASSSAAALMRTSNNRSFVDERTSQSSGSSFLVSSTTGSPTPSQHTCIYHQSGQYIGRPESTQTCEPGTPHQHGDTARHTPFGHHASFHNSIISSQGNVTVGEDYIMSEPLNSKLNKLILNGGYDQQKGGGIWGPRK